MCVYDVCIDSGTLAGVICTPSSHTNVYTQFIVATYVLYLCLLLESFWVYRMATHKPAQQEVCQGVGRCVCVCVCV